MQNNEMARPSAEDRDETVTRGSCSLCCTCRLLYLGQLPWMGLQGGLRRERRAEAFEAFQGCERATAGLNAFKSTWPWCLAAGV